MRVRYILPPIVNRFFPVHGSIPAMRVRYIVMLVCFKMPSWRFNSRYAGKIHQSSVSDSLPALEGSIPAMRVRYIMLTHNLHNIIRFNSRYAGKIHHVILDQNIPVKKGSIPAMRVRYIGETTNGKL